MRTTEDKGITRGSDNVFADLGYSDADLRQTKLAAAVITILYDRR